MMAALMTMSLCALLPVRWRGVLLLLLRLRNGPLVMERAAVHVTCGRRQGNGWKHLPRHGWRGGRAARPVVGHVRQG